MSDHGQYDLEDADLVIAELRDALMTYDADVQRLRALLLDARRRLKALDAHQDTSDIDRVLVPDLVRSDATGTP